jgi:hypothetical protein
LLGLQSSYAQNTTVDMRQDWYGEVPTIDMGMLDTITLRPFRGTFDDPKKDIYLWHYNGGNDYVLRVYNNTDPGVRDPYVFAPEKWRLKEVSPEELYLTVRDHKSATPFRNKIATYRIFLHRDNYHILTNIILVRQYQFRHYQRVKTPTLMN